MNRYTIILDEWNRIVEGEMQLEFEYKDQKKGEIYLKKKLDISLKKDKLKQQVLNIGVTGTVCKVSGKRSRPSFKNPRVLINERFTIYFVNVSEEEIQSLIPFHVKNVIHSKVEFFKPGIILTTD